MDKKYNIIALIIIVCEITSLLVYYHYLDDKKINHISEILNLNIKNCKISNEKDTHGGFLGDGEYFATITCQDTENNEIENKWKTLPLSNELQMVLNIKDCHSSDCKNFFEKYNIPNIVNGYYIFYDRYSNINDRRSESNINNRSSYNFSIGIYESDTKTIYYYELDT